MSSSTCFTVERTYFLVHFKIVIFLEQCSAASTKSSRFLITNPLLKVVLYTSRLILPPIPFYCPFPVTFDKEIPTERLLKQCHSTHSEFLFELSWSTIRKNNISVKFPDMFKVINQHRHECKHCIFVMRQIV